MSALELKPYLSVYTHVDGSRWEGPIFWAENEIEAQVFAMGYPWQPLEIIGQVVHAEATARALKWTLVPPMTRTDGRLQ